MCMAALCAEGRTRDSPHFLLGAAQTVFGMVPVRGVLLGNSFFLFSFFFPAVSFFSCFVLGAKALFQTAVTLHYLKGGSDHTVS